MCSGITHNMYFETNISGLLRYRQLCNSLLAQQNTAVKDTSLLQDYRGNVTQSYTVPLLIE